MAPKKKEGMTRPKDVLSTIKGEEKLEQSEQIRQALDSDSDINYADIESMSNDELLGFADDDAKKEKISSQRYFDMLKSGQIINDENADREIVKRLSGEVKAEMILIKNLKAKLKAETDAKEKSIIRSKIKAAEKRIADRRLSAETLILRLTEKKMVAA